MELLHRARSAEWLRWRPTSRLPLLAPSTYAGKVRPVNKSSSGLKNDWQVPNTGENFIFFIQQVLSNAYKWRSSEDYSIRIDTTFNDKSRAIFAYDSAKRAIVYVEAYDSAGNLIGTSSSEPINVDYSSYESPGAASRPDYQRGIDWLTSSGAATISGGTVTVGSGTVLVGDVVQVK